MRIYWRINIVTLAAIIIVMIPCAFPQTKALITDSRPLAKAAALIELKLGVPVDYEDAEYVWNGDVVDVTNSTARSEYIQAHPGLKLLGPRGGTLEITVAQGDEVTAVLQNAVKLHEQKDLPGRFQVRQMGSRFSIVPVQVKTAEGVLNANAAVLEAKISVPHRDWTGEEIVQFVCKQVNEVTGKKIGEGMVPSNLLRQTVVNMGANDESGRDVLLKVFAGIHYKDPGAKSVPQLAWRLLYGPDVKQFALNIHVVMVEKPAAFGGTEIQSLDRVEK